MNTIIKTEIRNTFRDPLLFMMPVAPLLIGIVFRFLIPFLDSLLLEYFSFNLVPHHTFISSFLLFLTPMIYSFVLGFNLIDERDEEILSYISVTPRGKAAYLFFRLGFPMLISILASYTILLLSGLVELPFLPLFPVVVLSSLGTPLFALILVATAENKVEAMAIGKGLGLFAFAPLLAYFISSPWQLMGGIVPPYWVFQAFLTVYHKNILQIGGGWDYPFFLVGGFLSHGFFIFLLLKRFIKRLG